MLYLDTSYPLAAVVLLISGAAGGIGKGACVCARASVPATASSLDVCCLHSCERVTCRGCPSAPQSLSASACRHCRHRAHLLFVRPSRSCRCCREGASPLRLLSIGLSHLLPSFSASVPSTGLLLTAASACSNCMSGRQTAAGAYACMNCTCLRASFDLLRRPSATTHIDYTLRCSSPRRMYCHRRRPVRRAHCRHRVVTSWVRVSWHTVAAGPGQTYVLPGESTAVGSSS